MGVIKNFVPPVAVKVNPFDKDVADLIAAGEGAAFELIGKTPEPDAERQRGTIDSDKRLFQDAARAAKHSAREVDGTREDLGDGTTRLVLILRPERKRKNASTDAA